MKVVKPGRAQQGWAKEYQCTGNGNKGGGCGATLLVEQGDLFKTFVGANYGGDTPEPVPTFKCGACGVLTDIPDGDVPVRWSELPSRADWEARPVKRFAIGDAVRVQGASESMTVHQYSEVPPWSCYVRGAPDEDDMVIGSWVLESDLEHAPALKGTP